MAGTIISIVLASWPHSGVILRNGPRSLYTSPEKLTTRGIEPRTPTAGAAGAAPPSREKEEKKRAAGFHIVRVGVVVTSSRFRKATRRQNKKYLTSIPLKGYFFMYTALVSPKRSPPKPINPNRARLCFFFETFSAGRWHGAAKHEELDVWWREEQRRRAVKARVVKGLRALGKERGRERN